MVTQAPAEIEVPAISNGEASTQDTPNEHTTVEEAIDAAVYATLDMNPENIIAIDDLQSHDFTLGGNIADTHDPLFGAPDNISTTNMRASPTSLTSLTPTSVTTFRDIEWEKADFLGDDL